jgi:peptide/nickel transport system ATP-binding protein
MTSQTTKTVQRQLSIEPTSLLAISDLKVQFRTDNGPARAVDGVSLNIETGETLALVGESGCGKSVTAYSILRLLPVPPAEYVSGEIRLGGLDLLGLSEKQMNAVRGNEISIIFQEPMSSLNPLMTVGRQITEAILAHQPQTRRQARTTSIEMLRRVGLSANAFNQYPHQLSGGMKQRTMIAMALVCRPRLLIADEPTTALDVTIQAQILDLLRELQREMGMSVLLITHDLGVVAETCDRVAVMYAGKIVEKASVSSLFMQPRHPYTIGLFRSLPIRSERKAQLDVIPGSVPNPLEFPSGCRFRTRCWMAQEICREEPPLREIAVGHLTACHFAEDLVTAP